MVNFTFFITRFFVRRSALKEGFLISFTSLDFDAFIRKSNRFSPDTFIKNLFFTLMHSLQQQELKWRSGCYREINSIAVTNNQNY
ncbi:hypothetical protein B0A71_16480 [Flavobacterium tructae]|uniref:Uncharacterized protein n=1 Tax=Flavobacterium tructae TaxID=1114873 RepID=A0A1S1J1S2_9FLAO|nr:hypothetical protein BHE19_16730 [Flavobacterium tructae]OXB17224.1 hypothetical protein B0A71_16480 [Flavobacterium tructae]